MGFEFTFPNSRGQCLLTNYAPRVRNIVQRSCLCTTTKTLLNVTDKKCRYNLIAFNPKPNGTPTPLLDIKKINWNSFYSDVDQHLYHICKFKFPTHQFQKFITVILDALHASERRLHIQHTTHIKNFNLRGGIRTGTRP